MQDLIAISGKQYAGKDQFADLLLKHLPEFQKVPIARAIKVEFAEMYNLTPDDVEERKSVYRGALIALGQRRRAQAPNYWLKRVFLIPGPKIVPDIRLKTEFEFFKQKHAFMIRIDADRSIRAKRGEIKEENDPTETELDIIDSWDAVIENNGSLADLDKQAQALAQRIREAFHLSP